MKAKPKKLPAVEVVATARKSGIKPVDMKLLGGSRSADFNHQIAFDTMLALWTKSPDQKMQDAQTNAAFAGLIGIAPQDELEGMMAAQLMASHAAAMECYRRAMIPEQMIESRRENLNQANKLSRTHTVLLEALNRHRGKGQQKVTVEHVHVHQGGQAIVGTVEHPGGGSASKSKDQAHAKLITNAPQPTMPSADPEGNGVPVTSDDEWPVSDARGKVARRSKG